ncbi:MAG TPA: hypothetical protein VIJ24_00395, partial [Verrucomicrobiae bacterium]
MHQTSLIGAPTFLSAFRAKRLATPSGQECPRSAENRDRGAGFSFFHFHTLAILTPSPQSGVARPSLRLDCSTHAVPSSLTWGQGGP